MNAFRFAYEPSLLLKSLPGAIVGKRGSKRSLRVSSASDTRESSLIVDISVVVLPLVAGLRANWYVGKPPAVAAEATVAALLPSVVVALGITAEPNGLTTDATLRV